MGSSAELWMSENPTEYFISEKRIKDIHKIEL